MASCREQAITQAAAAYADFLQFGPNANPDPFFLPNVFARDTDEVYPVANWWLCGNPPHSAGQQEGSLPKPRSHGATGPRHSPGLQIQSALDEELIAKFELDPSEQLLHDFRCICAAAAALIHAPMPANLLQSQ